MNQYSQSQQGFGHSEQYGEEEQGQEGYGEGELGGGHQQHHAGGAGRGMGGMRSRGKGPGGMPGRGAGGHPGRGGPGHNGPGARGGGMNGHNGPGARGGGMNGQMGKPGKMNGEKPMPGKGQGAQGMGGPDGPGMQNGTVARRRPATQSDDGSPWSTDDEPDYDELIAHKPFKRRGKPIIGRNGLPLHDFQIPHTSHQDAVEALSEVADHGWTANHTHSLGHLAIYGVAYLGRWGGFV